MRRILLWTLTTVSVLVLLFGYNTSTSGPMATSAPTSVQSIVTGPSGGPSPGSSASSSAKTVTGSVASTRWGPVQVALTIANHKISKIAVVQYPAGNSRDAEINNYALPILQQETLSAQSFHIDMVSGATVTSTGYIQSLQSALDQAGL